MNKPAKQAEIVCAQAHITDTATMSTILLHAIPEKMLRDMARELAVPIDQQKGMTAIRCALALKQAKAAIVVAIVVPD